MAQQIKKKFIQNDAVDGSKVKLLKDQSLRGQKQDGSDVELLKLDGSDKLVSDGKEVAFKSDVEAEQSRAEGEEARIEGLLSSEVSDRQSEVSRVEGLLSAEESARQAADLDLQGQIESEEDRAMGVEGDLQTQIDAEETRAQGEESRIEGKVDQEISDRQSAISTEEAARISGDQNLQSQVDTEKGRIDAILSASQADKDSFAEIVELINSVDTENDSAFASYVLSNNAALAQEVSDRQSGDQTLQSSIDSEESRAMVAESLLQQNLNSEASSRQTADQDLQSQIDSEESRAMAAESALSGRVSTLEADAVTKTYVDTKDGLLQTAITAEETARIAGDAALQATIENLDGYSMDVRDDLDAEIAARIAGDLDLQGQVDAEESARIAGDASLQSSLNQEISDRQAAVSSEASARQSADQTLQSNIDSEESRAMGEESRIESKFDGMMSTEQAARIAGDATLQSAVDVEKGRIDAILSASQADKDSFAEIVELINSVDTENDSAFASYVLSNNQALSDEVSARQSAVSAEESARIAADQGLQSQIDAEVARATEAEGFLQADIITETQARQAAVSELSLMVDENFMLRNANNRADGYESISGLFKGTAFFELQSPLDNSTGATLSYSQIQMGNPTYYSRLNGNNLQFQGNGTTGIFGSGIMFMRVPEYVNPDNTFQFYMDNLDSGQVCLTKSVFGEEQEQPSMPTLPSSLVVKAYVDQEVSDLQSQINSINSEIDGPYFEKQKFVIDESSELSSIELSHECIENSLVVCVGRLMAHKDEDYSVSVVGGKTVLTWMGDFAQGGSEGIESGDVIFVTFARQV